MTYENGERPPQAEAMDESDTVNNNNNAYPALHISTSLP
jgi:hypothetical protein